MLEENLRNFAQIVERLEVRVRQQERPASTAPVLEVYRPLSAYNGSVDLYVSPFTGCVEYSRDPRCPQGLVGTPGTNDTGESGGRGKPEHPGRDGAQGLPGPQVERGEQEPPGTKRRQGKLGLRGEKWTRVIPA